MFERVKNFLKGKEGGARGFDKGVSEDMKVFGELQPQIDNFLENLKTAESIQDGDTLEFVLRNLERQFDEIKEELKKTFHGAQYFRESDDRHKDSLEEASSTAVYYDTPLRHFRDVEIRLKNLKTRLEVILSDHLND